MEYLVALLTPGHVRQSHEPVSHADLCWTGQYTADHGGHTCSGPAGVGEREEPGFSQESWLLLTPHVISLVHLSALNLIF